MSMQNKGLDCKKIQFNIRIISRFVELKFWVSDREAWNYWKIPSKGPQKESDMVYFCLFSKNVKPMKSPDIEERKPFCQTIKTFTSL